MNWTKLLYVLIIVLLYVPMVFLGANVFFPKYSGVDSYYSSPYYVDCGMKLYAPDSVTLTAAEKQALTAEAQECNERLMQEQRAWETEKAGYEGYKYVLITIFNLVVLLLALFIPKLQDSVSMGLFLGSIVATFGATIRYFDSRSKIGFVILVITFFVMLYFINRKKDTFIDWKTKKKK